MPPASVTERKLHRRSRDHVPVAINKRRGGASLWDDTRLRGVEVLDEGVDERGRRRVKPGGKHGKSSGKTVLRDPSVVESPSGNVERGARVRGAVLDQLGMSPCMTMVAPTAQRQGGAFMAN